MPPINKKHIALAALGIVIIGIAALILRCGRSEETAAAAPPKKPEPEAVSITRDDILRSTEIEAPDPEAPGSFSVYPAGSLPAPVSPGGRADYPTLRNHTVSIAIDARTSSAPLLLRNRGMAPGAAWTAADGTSFRVELVRIDDPVALRDAFAAGGLHAACGTVGVLAGWAPGLAEDPRSAPRIFQQLDWSAGADCLVIRRSAAADPAHPTPADLRMAKGGVKKKIVAVEDSPSEEFVVRTLIEAGIQPGEVEWIPARDPLQAAAMFRTDPSIAACAGATPEIRKLGETKDHAILATTARDRRLLAGVWFARADFARDHPELCEGIARGIFEGIAALKTPQGRRDAAELMAATFGFPGEDCRKQLEATRFAGPAENRNFFLNRNNPANFQNTWRNACTVHEALGQITKALPFTAVVDVPFVQRLVGTEPPTPGREPLMAPPPAIRNAIRLHRLGNGAEILVESFAIRFAPNSWDLPGAAATTLDEVARLVAFRKGQCTIVIDGYADASMRSKTDTQLARDLSLNRARSVKAALLNRLPDFAPSRISTVAHGWSHPAEPDHPAANRRAEITVLPK